MPGRYRCRRGRRCPRGSGYGGGGDVGEAAITARGDVREAPVTTGRHVGETLQATKHRFLAGCAAFVLPSSGGVVNLRVDIAGTLFGALCFLIGAVLMFPAWRQAVRCA